MNNSLHRLQTMALRARLALATLLLGLGTTALASEQTAAPSVTSVEFSVSASETARNDVATVQLYAEHSAADSASAAAEVNRRIAGALKRIAEFPAVQAKTTTTSSWPVYADNSDGRIKAWRMRTEIQLETRDFDVLSSLLGELQNVLAIAGIQMRAAPATRRAAIDAATVAALSEFERRARLLASTLGKRHRTVALNLSEGGYEPMPRMRALASPALMAEASPAPLEAGDSELSVRINGRIELID